MRLEMGDGLGGWIGVVMAAETEPPPPPPLLEATPVALGYRQTEQTKRLGLGLGEVILFVLQPHHGVSQCVCVCVCVFADGVGARLAGSWVAGWMDHGWRWLADHGICARASERAWTQRERDKRDAGTRRRGKERGGEREGTELDGRSCCGGGRGGGGGGGLV